MSGWQDSGQTMELTETAPAVPGIVSPEPCPIQSAIDQRRAGFKRPASLDRYVDANGAVLLVNKPVSSARMAAMAAFGILIGAGSILIFSSFVRASSDAGLFELVPGDSRARREMALRPNAMAPSVQMAALNPTMPVSARMDGATLTPGADRILGPVQPSRAGRKLTPVVMHTPGSQQIAAGMSRRTVCVRMCDGYHFPIGRLNASDNPAAHEAMCKAACPAAPVKLFTIAAGHEGIESAVSADGRSYRSLPMAYAHEQGSDPTCGCDTAETVQRLSLLRDPTLRKGDMVVIEGGAKVFSGKDAKDQTPVTLGDFADFRQSSALSPADRRTLDTLVGQARRSAVLNDLKRKARAQDARGPKAFANGKGAGAEQQIVIRSGTSRGERTTVRVITPSLFTQPR